MMIASPLTSLAIFASLCAAIPYPPPNIGNAPYPRLSLRQAGNTTTPSDPPASSPSPASVWHITVNPGSSSFQIGDFDASQFGGMMAAACSANGCDGGSPQDFEFKGISSGQVEHGSGSITLSGFVDNNQVITDDLLAAMGAAWQASASCEEQTATYCPPFDARRSSSKRDALGGPVPCDYKYELRQCTMANYVSATMYDDSSDVKGNVVLSASSHVDSPGAFDCGAFLSGMAGAATAAELNPIIIGGTVIASVICGAAT